MQRLPALLFENERLFKEAGQIKAAYSVNVKIISLINGLSRRHARMPS